MTTPFGPLAAVGLAASLSAAPGEAPSPAAVEVVEAIGADGAALPSRALAELPDLPVGAEARHAEGGPPEGTTPAHRIIYLNPDGGMFVRGRSNSSQDKSGIINVDIAEVSAFSLDDDAWDAVVACVTEVYAPFDVEITDEDPVGQTHIEIVVGGTPEEIGWEDVLGLGTRPGDCSVNETSVGYVFEQVITEELARNLNASHVQMLCDVAVQESAHALGLEHVVACEDPMSGGYVKACGQRAFQDAAVQCGAGKPSACSCGGTTQNTYQHLMQVLGEANEDSGDSGDSGDDGDDPYEEGGGKADEVDTAGADSSDDSAAGCRVATDAGPGTSAWLFVALGLRRRRSSRRATT